jgi:high-affinity nickel-transport protein
VLEDDGQYNNTIMMKILGPVIRFVDRPWKVILMQSFILRVLIRTPAQMYPVGVLFGFGKGDPHVKMPLS